MKTPLVIVAVCVLVLLTSLVVGQEQQPLPQGVSAANWISADPEVAARAVPDIERS